MTQQTNQKPYALQEQQNIAASTQLIHDKQSQATKLNCCTFLVDFIKLYSYAEKPQKMAIALGVMIGIVSGVSHPIFIYLWFQQLALAIRNQNDLDPFMDDFRNYLFYFVALGCAVLIINTLLFVIWKYVSRSISKKIRIRYLQQFIKQSLPQVETKNGYEWANEFKIHTLNIEKSIGDKVALFLNLVGIVVSGLTSALIIRWTFSLYMLIITPFGIAILVYFIYIQVKKKQINAESNKQAQNKALQACTMIKTVKMLNGEQKQVRDYEEQLIKGEQRLKQYNIKLGISTGLFYFIQYLFFGVGFLMGIQCVKGSDFCPTSATGSKYGINQFLSVFFQIFFCTYNFLQLGSNYSLIKSAITSSKILYAFIEKPKVNRQQKQFETALTIERIEFKRVVFCYPSNPQKPILSNLNLQFLPSKFNAIVGQTGSGKSTIIQLLLKQYSPNAGEIMIDEINLSCIKIGQWLDKIGVVTQQPVLFDGTIRQNVLVGKANASEEQIIDALTQANIYDFVMSKQQGLDFQIGTGGSKLSGGQKQRIAIARALVKKPLLLILDQATSALDPATQKQIQQALQQIRKNLQNKITIICIAHRIGTIRNADRIFLTKEGHIYESGIFQELQYFRQMIFPEKQQQEQQQQESNHSISLQAPLQQQNPQRQQEIQQNLPKQQQKQIFIYSQLLSYTSGYKWYILCLLLAVIIGFNHLVAAILVSYHLDQLNRFVMLGNKTDWCHTLLILSDACNIQLDKYFQQSQKYLYGMIGLAVFTFFPYFIQVYILSKIQNQISFNLKKDLFKKLLSLQVKFFEMQQNESGGASSQFGNDSRDSSSLVTAYVPILISNLCAAVGAVTICMSYDWRYGLLSLLVTPLISLAFYIAMLFIGGYEDSSLQTLHKSDRIANELITNIKTVLVLNYQKRFLQKYKKLIDEPFNQTFKVGGKIGLLYGLSFFILDIAVGCSLYLSIIILKNNPEIQPISIIIYMIVSVFSGFIIGNNFYFVAHTTAGKKAAARVMKLIDAKSQQQIQRKKSSKIVQLVSCKGKIEFRNVTFKYKSDDSRLVLDNISLSIEAGSKVGFVGQSGCGKSTLLQLLLRFYQFQGEIFVDGKNIYSYDLKSYRSKFAMLNQEPSLFAGTIEENIKYNQYVEKERMIEVCCKACAYYIGQNCEEEQSIKRFKERRVGPKGSNISGGEKQRVACARALVRNAAIFMMDEGTSALDKFTEKKVQNGVNQEYKGRTVINVAHRIQSIENSDKVYVFSDGRIAEFGKPSELLKRRGMYYNFVNGHRIA